MEVAMPEDLSQIGANVIAFLPTLLSAILILVVGWIVAVLISRLVGRLLHKTSIDDRLASTLKGGSPERIPVERWISTAVFWLIMVFVIIIFLQTLNLGQVSEPLNVLLAQILAFIPNLIAAGLLALLAFVIATVLRMIISRVLSASMFTKRVTDSADVQQADQATIGQTIGNVVFWLVLLLFLPAILDTLNLGGMLSPIQLMVTSILSALPNILGFALILIVGWLVARIIRQIVANLLVSVGVDRLVERTGGPAALRERRISDVLATIVFVLIMVPVAIAAFNVLNIPAISVPAAAMLTTFLNALPAIFAAILLLVIAYFIARFVGTFVASLLAGIGFDRIFSSSGIIPVTSFRDTTAGEDARSTVRRTAEPGEVQPGRTTPSEIVGYIVTVAILLFAAMEAASLLGFEALVVLIGGFIAAAGNVLVGLLIFGIGLYLANFADRMIRNTGSSQANVLAPAARIAILVFSGALALRQMGLGQDIVNLAFGLLLGAVAIAAAIAFGLGGREVAGDVLERWRNRIQVEASKPPRPAPMRTPRQVEIPVTSSTEETDDTVETFPTDEQP